MTFGLVAVALIFVSLALLLLGKGAEQESRERAEIRLERALSHSLNPMALHKDPLKKKYIPQFITDNLISAGLIPDKALAFKTLALLLVPTLLAVGLRGPASATGVLVLLLLGVVVYVLYRQRKRRLLMLSQLPAFLDGVVRVSAVGYSLTVSFNTALENADQPLKDALGMAVQMQFAGLELDEAMQRLARVYGLSEFKLIASVVGLALNYGGKSDILLSRLAQYLRDREQHHKELMAMSSEARTSAIFMCCLTPALAGLILTLNPGYIGTMWNDGTGRLLLLAAGGLQAFGAAVIYRMVKSI
ncbi:type II secretion system F family protein [Limnobacter humi]|uniref:Type II secretion system F family protein n=1 Tax=Limnobacter humi TaxID=1778671 RepID=A0ABT1WBP8_9BURK|nr:type II secretion system F family protein [Limnobacter humi]MCQ8894931.1 type II secretion system F family protein [Limnobacter humi]